MLLMNTFPERTKNQKDPERQVQTLDQQHQCYLDTCQK